MAAQDPTRTGSLPSSGIGLSNEPVEVRRKVQAGAEHLRESAAEFRQGAADLRTGVEESVANRATRVRRAVHAHPMRSVSMAMGTGVLLAVSGLLAYRAVQQRRNRNV